MWNLWGLEYKLSVRWDNESVIYRCYVEIRNVNVLVDYVEVLERNVNNIREGCVIFYLGFYVC